MIHNLLDRQLGDCDRFSPFTRRSKWRRRSQKARKDQLSVLPSRAAKVDTLVDNYADLITDSSLYRINLTMLMNVARPDILIVYREGVDALPEDFVQSSKKKPELQVFKHVGQLQEIIRCRIAFGGRSGTSPERPPSEPRRLTEFAEVIQDRLTHTCIQLLQKVSNLIVEDLNNENGYSKQFLSFGGAHFLVGALPILIPTSLGGRGPELFVSKLSKRYVYPSETDRVSDEVKLVANVQLHHMLSLILDIIRDICMSSREFTQELGRSENFMQLLFRLMRLRPLFEQCVPVIEELLAFRKRKFEIQTIPDLESLVNSLSYRQLAAFCRMLPHMVYSQEEDVAADSVDVVANDLSTANIILHRDAKTQSEAEGPEKFDIDHIIRVSGTLPMLMSRICSKKSKRITEHNHIVLCSVPTLLEKLVYLVDAVSKKLFLRKYKRRLRNRDDGDNSSVADEDVDPNDPYAYERYYESSDEVIGDDEIQGPYHLDEESIGRVNYSVDHKILYMLNHCIIDRDVSCNEIPQFRDGVGWFADDLQQTYGIHLLQHRADLVFVMSALASGKHKEIVQDFLSPVASPILCRFLDQLDTDHKTSPSSVLPLHGPDCTCGAESHLKVQVLRLIHALCERNSDNRYNKQQLLSQRQRTMVESMTCEQLARRPNHDDVEDTERGVIWRVVNSYELLESSMEAEFWLSSCIIAFLRGNSFKEQILMIRWGLLDRILDWMLRDNFKLSSSLQTNFDLLGEIVKYNSFVVAYIRHRLTEAEFLQIMKIALDNLVDSNVFLCCLIISLERFASVSRDLTCPCEMTNGDGQCVPHECRRVGDKIHCDNCGRIYGYYSFENCFIYKWFIKNRLTMLRELMVSISVHDISQENLCCINTTILLLLLANRRNNASAYLEGCKVGYMEIDDFAGTYPESSKDIIVRARKSPSSDEKLGDDQYLLRFAGLLLFWVRYYGLLRSEESAALSYSSGVSQAEFHQVVSSLCRYCKIC